MRISSGTLPDPLPPLRPQDKTICPLLLGLALLLLAGLGGCGSLGGGEKGAPPGGDGAGEGAGGDSTAAGTSITRQAAIPPGAQCPAGGYQIEFGIDVNGDGVLGADEVDGTATVCTGEDGNTGRPGATGSSSGVGEDASLPLVVITDEAAGAVCPSGGQRVDVGLDNGDGGGIAGDGVLQAGEIDGTSYDCDGRLGASEGTPAAPVALTVESTHGANVAGNGASYYSFTAPAADNYLIALGGGSSDLAWTLYSDAAFTTVVKECNLRGRTGSESCFSGPLTASQPYYLRVRELGNQGGAFNLNIMPPFVLTGMGGLAFRPSDYSTFSWIAHQRIGYSSLTFDSASMTLYGGTGTYYSGGCRGCIFELDPATERNTIITTSGYAVPGLALAPDGTLYGIEMVTRNLISIDIATNSHTLLGEMITGLFPKGNGMSYDGSGLLYAVNSSYFNLTTNYSLFYFDPTTPSSTLAVPLTFVGGFKYAPDTPNAMTVWPGDGRVFITTRSGDLGTLDLCTGVLTFVASLSDDYVNGLAAISGEPLPYPALCDLAGTGVTASVDLSWRPYPVADSFNIYWSTTVGIDPANPATYSGVINGITGTAYTHGGLTAATVYYYLVTTVVGGAEVGRSAEASATPL